MLAVNSDSFPEHVITVDALLSVKHELIILSHPILYVMYTDIRLQRDKHHYVKANS